MPINSASPRAQSGADLGACRSLLSGGSKSFHAASLLLPRALRDSATALYAFCRIADDAVDGGGDMTVALQMLRQRLDLIYGGRPLEIPADRAFAEVVRRYAIPRALPEALLDGFAWDAAGRRYRTLEDLQGYAARVAGSVGVMMALLMGRRDPQVLARAGDLGVAMQLTNIARDVGEDARSGRLYLPENWLLEVGIDPDAWLAEPHFDPRLQSVLQLLLAEADTLYERAAVGIAGLPWRCRPGMHAARLLYAEIGAVVREQRYDSVTARARVSLARKVALLPQALGAALRPGGELAGELDATRFLIDAVGAQRPLPASATAPEQSRAEWLLELFERLEREQLT